MKPTSKQDCREVTPDMTVAVGKLPPPPPLNDRRVTQVVELQSIYRINISSGVAIE